MIGDDFVNEMLPHLAKRSRYMSARVACWAWGGLSSILLSYRNKILVYSDRGVWIHRHFDGYVVDRAVTSKTLTDYTKNAIDNWYFLYRPKPGDVIVDIGAGKGEDAYCFSNNVSATGKVIAIEAHPGTYACLARFCQLNKLMNVTTVNLAICAAETELTIDDPEHDNASTIVGATGAFAVRGAALDTICESLHLHHIDFVKMNIEGAEVAALAGMTRVIPNVKYLCIACHDFMADRTGNQAMRTKTSVAAFLTGHNFRVVFREHDPRPWIRDQLNAVNMDLADGQ